MKATIRPIHSRYGDFLVTVGHRKRYAVGTRGRAEAVAALLIQHFDYLALDYDGGEVTIRQDQIEREILRAGGFQA